MRSSIVQMLSGVAGLLCVTLLISGAPLDTRLSVAAMNGDLTAVQTLLRQGAAVNDAQGDGTTALHWAASRGDLAMTRLLLKSKARVDAKTRLNQMTPLFMAARSGHAAIIDALVKAGADARSVSAVGTTALMLAAASGRADAVQALVKAGADVNARDVNQGQTALMFAAASGRAEVIRILAANGAGVNATSLVPTRLTKSGARSSFPSPANNPAAQNNSAARGTPGPQPAEAGGPRGRGAAVNKPLALGGMTAMQFAAREGHMDAVRALVESGADVNVPTASDQMSTLTLSIVNGRYDMAKYLLERGADPKPASAEEATALFTALDTKWAPLGWYPAPKIDNENVDYLELMRLLLDKGANVNARMSGRMWMRITGPGGGPVYTGETAFLRAAQANDIDAMKFLISRGANPSVMTTKGTTALMLAAGMGHRPSESHVKPDSRLATVRFLLEELNFDVNARDVDGFTALHGAASIGSREVIEYLVANGGDVKARSNSFVNPAAAGTARIAAQPAAGETVADMANGPAEKTLVYPEIVKLLVSIGSEFSDNCRAAVCVNKPRQAAPAAPAASPAPRPAPAAPEVKKPGGAR